MRHHDNTHHNFFFPFNSRNYQWSSLCHFLSQESWFLPFLYPFMRYLNRIHTCFVLLGLNKLRSLSHPSSVLCFSPSLQLFTGLAPICLFLPCAREPNQAKHSSAVLQNAGKREAITSARLFTIILQPYFKIKPNSTPLLKVIF